MIFVTRCFSKWSLHICMYFGSCREVIQFFLVCQQWGNEGNAQNYELEIATNNACLCSSTQNFVLQKNNFKNIEYHNTISFSILMRFLNYILNTNVTLNIDFIQSQFTITYCFIKIIKLKIMIINSNDIFSQIGLAVDAKSHNNYVSKPKYIIYLEIELSEDQKQILEVRDTDNPYTVAYQFCTKHKLNKLAISIVENKVREAMQMEEEKLRKKGNKTGIQTKKSQQNMSNLAKSQRKTSFKNKQTPVKAKLKYEMEQAKNSNNPVSPSKSKSRKKIQSQIIDNIYLRSLVKARLIEEHRNKLKVEMEKKEEEELTFKPKINNVSEKIIEFLRTNNIQKEKKPSPPKKVYEEMRECTFKPQINKVSERIINNKSLIKEQRDQYNKLYKNENQTGSKSKKYLGDEQCSFKPQINPKSASKISVPFFKRLEINEERRIKEANKQRCCDEEEYSFQPKVGRAPLKERNKQNLNVWDHLHYGSKKNEDATSSKDVGVSKVSKQTTVSQQYYENLIEERINKVFETLDSNKDGLISPNQIAIELLPMDCLHFLKPIFMQMDEVDATLTYHDFKRAVQALLADSDPGKRGAFLSSKWKKQLEDQQSFRPNINKRSKEMSANRSVENLYKQGLKEKRNRQYKLQRQRALKQQKQLAECSFKPVLNHSSKVYIDKITKKRVQHKPSKNVSQMIQSLMKQNDLNQQKSIKDKSLLQNELKPQNENDQ